MKNFALLVTIICLFNAFINKSFSQSAPPPNGFERGMYVDCADDIIYDMDPNGNNSTILKDNLLADIQTWSITYIALFRIDNIGPHYSTPVLIDPDLQGLLSDLIDYLKQNVPGLQVGIVISSKQDASKTNLYDYGNVAQPSYPCLGSSFANQLNSDMNPMLSDLDPADTSTAKNKALMIRSCFNVRYYNEGLTDLDTCDFLERTYNPGGHIGKIDWISIEKEYWSDPDYDANELTETYAKAYSNYLEIIQAAALQNCFTSGGIRVESELRIVDNGSNCHCPLWNTNNSYCPPDGQTQADDIDPYLDRVLLVDYFKFKTALFDWHCNNIYFLGNSSNNTGTVIWPLFSAEFPGIGEVYCTSGDPIPDCNEFLGLRLSVSNVSIVDPCPSSGTYNTTIYGSNEQFYDEEYAWLTSQSTSNYSCSQCGTSFSAGTFDQNNNDNTYNGFMWFTYTMMRDEGFLKLAQGQSNSNDYKDDFLIFPNPSSSTINLRILKGNIFENNVSVTFINSMGAEIENKIINLNQGHSDFCFSGFSSGIYLLKLINNLGEGVTQKFTIVD